MGGRPGLGECGARGEAPLPFPALARPSWVLSCPHLHSLHLHKALTQKTVHFDSGRPVGDRDPSHGIPLRKGRRASQSSLTTHSANLPGPLPPTAVPCRKVWFFGLSTGPSWVTPRTHPICSSTDKHWQISLSDPAPHPAPGRPNPSLATPSSCCRPVRPLRQASLPHLLLASTHLVPPAPKNTSYPDPKCCPSGGFVGGQGR